METFEEFMMAMKALREENERGFAELREQQKENARGFAELREQQKERAKEREIEREEYKKQREIEREEYKKQREIEREEYKKQQEERDKKSEKEWAQMRKDLGGIGRKNGKMAEDYFFNSLEKTKTLGGVHFDAVKRNLKGSVRLDGGKTLDGEYDIALINEDSLGIVEVKYTVEKEDVEKLVKEQVESFKSIFPTYANYKFYLGIGGMSFDRQAEDAAKKLGVGIFKLNGDAVEIYDKNLKVY